MRKKILSSLLVFLVLGSVLSQPCPDSSLYLHSQAQIDSFPILYPNCSEINGEMVIGGEDVTNLNGLNSLTTIHGDLFISDWVSTNPMLTSFTGLENLTYIGGTLWLSGNEAVINCTGFDNLKFIGDGLVIGDNISLISLTGLENVDTISSLLGVVLNPVLTDLTGLSGVKSIGVGIYIEDNDILTSLSGLNNIFVGTITELGISENPKLSVCAIKSICAYLSNPIGEFDIHDNAQGCNSPEEVKDSCEAHAGYNDIWLNNDFLSIFPNPAHVELNITAEGFSIDEVIIYTIAGQQVFAVRPKCESIDISTLQPGMYIVEVMVEGRKIRQKLLVQR